MLTVLRVTVGFNEKMASMMKSVVTNPITLHLIFFTFINHGLMMNTADCDMERDVSAKFEENDTNYIVFWHNWINSTIPNGFRCFTNNHIHI